jgi:hypothetical protein
MNPLDGIVKFNVDRKLETFDASAESTMLAEELQEFWSGYSLGDEYEMIDALCDIIVVAAGAIHKLGYDPTEVLSETVKEITSRQGTFNEVTGKWEKDRNQDPSTLYKAVYSRKE